MDVAVGLVEHFWTGKVTASSFQVTLCSKNACMITVSMDQRSPAKRTRMLMRYTRAQEHFIMGKEEGRNE